MSPISLPNSSERLRQRIAASGGWLSFERFMETALYDPQAGYYTRRMREIGRRGDFATSASVGNLLGRALAGWLRAHRHTVRRGTVWHVIETGGGNGLLAEALLEALGWRGRWGLRYHLVEISPVLEQLQRERLGRFAVQWHGRIEQALERAGGRALLFSNELVDAFPCRVFDCKEGDWQEIGCAWGGAAAREIGRPVAREELAELQSSALEWSWEKEQRVEVQAGYREYLRQIASRLLAGAVLTIDYGDTFPQLYERRPRGTLRGFFHHQRVEENEIWQRLGHQDLTADVNFTDLQHWGTPLGLRTESLETQREFLMRWAPGVDPAEPGNARVLDPLGAGSAFKVLLQRR